MKRLAQGFRQHSQPQPVTDNHWRPRPLGDGLPPARAAGITELSVRDCLTTAVKPGRRSKAKESEPAKEKPAGFVPIAATGGAKG